MSIIIEDLNWRYAVDQFDPKQKVSDDDLNTILEAFRLAPSSYGLQPLKLLVIENHSLRSELLAVSYNQRQVVDCSHLLVICAYEQITETIIDELMLLTSAAQNKSMESMAGYAAFLKRTILAMEPDDMKQWNSRQAYIALGHILHTCAQLRIDSTPMEGFQKEAYDELLGLKGQNLHSVVACPIGYRSEHDTQQHQPKVRKPLNDVVEYYR
jgi:nitroreductase/dihydropteridine reductase